MFEGSPVRFSSVAQEFAPGRRRRKQSGAICRAQLKPGKRH
jgi:hypothetical protein